MSRMECLSCGSEMIRAMGGGWKCLNYACRNIVPPPIFPREPEKPLPPEEIDRRRRNKTAVAGAIGAGAVVYWFYRREEATVLAAIAGYLFGKSKAGSDLITYAWIAFLAWMVYQLFNLFHR